MAVDRPPNRGGYNPVRNPQVTVKPPFTYFGGKQGIADAIVDLLPDHEHYVEPYAGSLAVLLAKPISRLETVNDLDHDLMTFWRVLRDQADELARLAILTPHSRAEYAECQDAPSADLPELERARRVWVKLTQGRSGVFRRTGWRHYQDPAGTSSPMPQYLAGYVDRIPAAATRLRHVSLECRDALDVIRDYGRRDGVLLYADPPYLGSTRGWGNNYRHELRTDDEHRALADALHAARAAVVLSGYHSPLYDELYAEWHRVEISSWTGNAKAGTGSRVEVIWANRSLTTDGDLTLFSEASA